jgi:hypothetical protein
MKMKLTVLSFVLVAVLAMTSIVFAADLMSGTWKINVAKSTFSPGPAPKSGTRTNTAVDGGMKAVLDGVNSEGKTTHTEYTVKFDGKDYPETPMLDGKANPDGADTISMKKIDDYNYEATTKKMGKVLTVSKVVISRDGKTITATATGKNVKGETVNTVTVTEKQ